MRATHSHRPVVLVVATVAALALVAGACTSDDGRSTGAATGRTQSAAIDPEAVPALAQPAGGAGPSAPVVDGAVLDGTIGTTTSLRPTLVWPGGATGPGPYEFTVRDLGPDGGRELWSSGDLPTASVAVPDDVLANGRAYRWSVTDGSGRRVGPLVFRVDVQRNGIQPVEPVGDAAVARLNGEHVFSWSSPTVATVDGPLGLVLQHRPTTGAETVGLPDGWRLGAVGGAGWRRVVANGDGTLTLERADGLPVVYEPNDGDGGGYRAVWGERQTWPTGQFATLSAATGGGFTLQDAAGSVTSFAAPGDDGVGFVTSVWTAGSPSAAERYDAGRLVSLTDPVSDRTITLTYAGSGTCPEPGPGFEPAPDGLLCAAELWDGTRMTFGYQVVAGTPRLTRLVANAGSGAGAGVTDLAYDAPGRVVALRSPSAVAAVAAGVRTADASVTTEITYDPAGRVEKVVLPAAAAAPAAAPAAGAPRAERTFTHAVADGRITSEVIASAAPDAPVVSTAVADASTFQMARATDALGRVTTATWDRASDLVVEQTDPSGMVVRTTTDPDGGMTRVGPASADAIAAGAAPRIRSVVDTTFDGPGDLEGEAMTGLAVTYWANANRSGDPRRSEVGPRIAGEVPDEYRFSWAEAPVQGDAWSARLAGVVELPAAGAWTLTTAAAALWVDERPCRPSCTVTAVGPRAARIRLEADGNSPDVDLSWSGPGRTGTVPTASLRPALSRQAALRTTESFRAGVSTEAVGRTEWADPVAGVLAASLTQTGSRRGNTTEPYRPGEDRWARVTAHTAPDGSVRALQYHPTRTPVDDPCSDASYVQGGLPRSNVDPAGSGVGQVVSTTVHDDGGRAVASRPGADAPWSCSTYDAAHRLVKVQQRGATGDEEAVVEYRYSGRSAAGAADPLVATITSVTASGDRATETAERDLLGQNVRSVDLWGTEVRTTYDPQFPGQISSTTVVPSGGGRASTTAYTYDASGARLTTVVDGVPLATYTYDDGGRPVRVTTGPNVITFSYDALGQVDRRVVSGPSGTWAEDRNLSPTGRVLRVDLDGPGTADATTEYTYDDDARLVGATLTTPLPAAERAWTFAWDGDNNLLRRTATLSDGTVRTVNNTYDRSDHLTGTDDPALAASGSAAQVAMDDLGRITTLGPLTLDYTAAGAAATVGHTDGSSVAWRHRFGDVVARTTTTPGAGPSTVRFGAAGTAYAADGTYLGRTVGGTGGFAVLFRADGSSRWTYATVGGNRWFTTDGAGALDGEVSLYEPFGRQVSPPLLPAATAPATTAPSTTNTTTTSTTTTSTSTTSTTTTSTTTTSTSTTTTAAAPTTTSGTDGSASGSVASGTPGGSTSPAQAASPLDPGFQMLDRSELGGLDVLPAGARTYLPTLGRFLQPDPIPGATGNPYGYTDGDPINSSDTSGMDIDWKTFAGALVLAAGTLLSAVGSPGVGVLAGQVFAGTSSLVARRAVEASVAALSGFILGTATAVVSSVLMFGEATLSDSLIFGASIALFSSVAVMATWRSPAPPRADKYFGRLKKALSSDNKGQQAAIRQKEPISNQQHVQEQASKKALKRVQKWRKPLDPIDEESISNVGSLPGSPLGSLEEELLNSGFAIGSL
ncbi:MAG: RHS repeat-associated core domain-containing protein [Microthrixaceae bacterium]